MPQVTVMESPPVHLPEVRARPPVSARLRGPAGRGFTPTGLPPFGAVRRVLPSRYEDPVPYPVACRPPGVGRRVVALERSSVDWGSFPTASSGRCASGVRRCRVTSIGWLWGICGWATLVSICCSSARLRTATAWLSQTSRSNDNWTLCWRSLGRQARTVWSAVRGRASSRFASQPQPRSAAHTRRPPCAPDRARPGRRRTRGFDRDGRIRPSDRRPHGPPPRPHARRHILRSGRPWRGQTGRTSSVPIAAAPLGGARVSFRIGLDQCLHLDRVLGRWGYRPRHPHFFRFLDLLS